MATYPPDPLNVATLPRTAQPATWQRQIWSTMVALGRRWGQLWPRA